MGRARRVERSTRVLAALAFVSFVRVLSAQGEAAVNPNTSEERAGLVNVGGHATISSEFYGAGGIAARRPGSLWRLNSGATTTLFGGMSLQVDAVASTEGVDFRQNVNQLGLSPTWWWGRISLGDFSMDYSPYVIQGVRVRGAGAMVDPGRFRVSLQGGRLERAEGAAGDAHQSFTRNVIAARGGIGSLERSSFNVSLLRAWDVVSNRPLISADTLFLDTLPADLRPSIDTRPQENVTVAFDGRLRLFQDRVDWTGEVATSLFSRDREASAVAAEGDAGSGSGSPIGGLGDIRLGSSIDYAYRTQLRVGVGAGRVEGRYERVGPGFGSLGLPFLLNDLQTYSLGGTYQLLQGRVAVQGRYLNQANNLESQRLNTVDRNTTQLNLALRPMRDFTANVSGMRTTMENDAADPQQRLDNVTSALTTSLSLRHPVLKLSGTTSLSHSVQLTESEDAWIGASRIFTYSLGVSHRLNVTRTISAAPSVSTVVTRGTGLEERRNVRLGFKGTGRFLDNRLRASTGVNHTTSQGRDVFGVQGQVSYPVVWGSSLSAQLRHMRYSALGQRPAFEETFLILNLSRSF